MKHYLKEILLLFGGEGWKSDSNWLDIELEVLMYNTIAITPRSNMTPMMVLVRVLSMDQIDMGNEFQ